MRLSWTTWVNPKSNDKCPYKKKAEGVLPLGEDHVKMEAEMGVMRLQDKAYQGLLAATRS